MNKKKLGTIIISAGILVGVVVGFLSAEMIKPGYVGIQYSMDGGVKDETLSQGLHFVNPLTKVRQYTVATEQAYLSKDKKEGSEGDDSFNIPTSDGKTVNVDLEFSYHFDADKLPEVYTRFKGESGKQIEETFIRGKMKAWAGEVSSEFSVIDVYGSKRAELNSRVLEHTKEKFKPYGVEIDTVNFSRIGLDEQTSKAIQDRINKQQELETAKIEVEKAKETSKKKEIDAKADAQAKLIQAEGEAKANEKLAKSITPELIKMKEAEARVKHGWLTVQGGTPIVDAKSK
ncbi:SPFH domain-containing protein [Clostridium sardiniense]